MASLAQSIVCSVERKKAFTSSVQMAPSKLHGIEYLAIGRRALDAATLIIGLRHAQRQSIGEFATQVTELVSDFKSRDMGAERGIKIGADALRSANEDVPKSASELGFGAKKPRISLRLAKIPLYTAPSHTETWLKRPSGGNRAVRLVCSHVSARNQPENSYDGTTRFFHAPAA